MIENIHIKNVASYDDQSLSGLSKQNYIYGSNGTGKTTISRIIANSNNFPECSLRWKGGNELETFVYNRDFVRDNFDQVSDLKGVFTLGKKDIDIIKKIELAKEELDFIKQDGQNLKKTLEGTDGNGGKQKELKDLELLFEDKFWNLKKDYAIVFKDALTGAIGNKVSFKNRLLLENNNNLADLKEEMYLRNKAKIVFGEKPLAVEYFLIPDYSILQNLKQFSILSKKIIGTQDVDIATMIKKLANSDWVQRGQDYLNKNGDLCPFCQQTINNNFGKKLESYFDETYKTNINEINQCFNIYEQNSISLIISIQKIIDNSNDFVDAQELEIQKRLLDSVLQRNLEIINKKKVNSSTVYSFESISDVMTTIEKQIKLSNSQISEYNDTVKNLKNEQIKLKNQIWKFFTNKKENEITDYISRKPDLEKTIEILNLKINDKRELYIKKENEIKALEQSTTSIQPTINGINDILHSFEFDGFYLEIFNKKFYKILRSDGTDAKVNLSEGERSFITFLYFYFLIKGSESESGISTDRIVVFDDPVSSLDSNILFIVSNLIKELLEKTEESDCNIKQILVLTHNVYFHKEVSFNFKRKKEALKNETFWIVRKVNNFSQITNYNTNPIKTSSELLWHEIKILDRSPHSIQNIMMRILENYFKILGGINTEKIISFFSGKEKLICKSLFSWVNDGSHFVSDDLFVSIDDSGIDQYLEIFKNIFLKSGHSAYYEMMMNEPLETKDNKES